MFALFPVPVLEGYTVWLEMVEVRLVSKPGRKEPIYRLPGSDLDEIAKGPSQPPSGGSVVKPGRTEKGGKIERSKSRERPAAPSPLKVPN